MKINGKPVVDGKKKLLFEVTPEDRNRGKRKSPSECPGALALKRLDKGIVGVRVHIGRTYLEYKDKWERYETPDSLRSEVVVHDREGKFEPGEYYLRPCKRNAHVLRPLSPSELSKRGKAHSPPGPKHGRPGRERVQHHVIRNVRPWGANV